MDTFGVGLAEIGTKPVFEKMFKEMIFQHCCTKCRFEFKSTQQVSTCTCCGNDTTSKTEAREGVSPETASIFA